MNIINIFTKILNFSYIFYKINIWKEYISEY